MAELSITMDDSIPQQAGPGAGADELRAAREALRNALRYGYAMHNTSMLEDTRKAIARIDAVLSHLAAPLAVEDSRERCASSDAEDAARLDYLQRTGSTIDLPSAGQGSFRFRIGGLHAAVHHDLRAAIDAAMAAASSGKEKME